jgi:hypothetical protein
LLLSSFCFVEQSTKLLDDLMIKASAIISGDGWPDHRRLFDLEFRLRLMPKAAGGDEADRDNRAVAVCTVAAIDIAQSLVEGDDVTTVKGS